MLSKGDFFTEAKLTLLYLLYKTGIRLSAEQIVACMNSNDIMNYFDVRSALGELVSAGLIYRHSEPGSSYSCSNAGREALGEFRVMIPASVREKLDAYIAQNLSELR